jgi:tetratricopeptide (TPR) repeat protein
MTYKKAIEIDTNCHPAFYNLGNSYYMISQFDNAIKSYKMALEKNPESAETYFSLATVYNDKEDY